MKRSNNISFLYKFYIYLKYLCNGKISRLRSHLYRVYLCQFLISRESMHSFVNIILYKIHVVVEDEFFSTLRIRSTVIIREEKANTLKVAIIDVPVIQDTWNKIFIRTVQTEKLEFTNNLKKKTTSLKTHFC